MLFHTYPDDYDFDDDGNMIIKSTKEEFTKVRGIRIDERTTDEPCKIGIYNNNKERADKEWYGEGFNHRIENGHIKRDFEDEFFVINLETIEDLLKFQDKYECNVSVDRNSRFICDGEPVKSFHFGYYME